MTEQNPNSLDDTLARAKALVEQQKRNEESRKNGGGWESKNPTQPPETFKDGIMNEVRETVAKNVTKGLEKGVTGGSSVWDWIKKPFVSHGNWLKKYTPVPFLWNFFDGKDKQGNPKESKAAQIWSSVCRYATRAWLLSWPLAPIPGAEMIPVVGPAVKGFQDIGMYWTWEPTMDVARASIGGIKHEKVYLTQATGNSADDDYDFLGTTKRGAASDEDAVFFKAENRLFSQAYNLATKGWPYIARHKAATVPPGSQDAYEVTYIGSNFRLSRMFNLKPLLLEVVRAPEQNQPAQTQAVPAATPVAPAPQAPAAAK